MAAASTFVSSGDFISLFQYSSFWIYHSFMDASINLALIHFVREMLY